MTWLSDLLGRFARWYIRQTDGLIDADVDDLCRAGAGRYAWFVEELNRRGAEYTETKKAGNVVILVKIKGRNGRPGFNLRFKFKERQ